MIHFYRIWIIGAIVFTVIYLFNITFGNTEPNIFIYILWGLYFLLGAVDMFVKSFKTTDK